jgi:TetR/AcrR family transcriptional regulator, transcriptional repressor for nem operon
MRRSAEDTEATGRRVLDAAGREFRAHGFAGIGVDGLARAAGVTSGAFYGHFQSKAAAFRQAAKAGAERLRVAVERSRDHFGGGWFDAFAADYLSPQHRRSVAEGCALPSLSSDVARADDTTRDDYADELKRVAASMAAGLPGGGGRQAAWAPLAQLAGGLLLARAVRDEALAQEIADAVLADLRVRRPTR